MAEIEVIEVSRLTTETDLIEESKVANLNLLYHSYLQAKEAGYSKSYEDYLLDSQKSIQWNNISW